MEQMAQSDRRVLNMALDTGYILLENDTEISRAGETMEKICTHYGVNTGEFFVLSMASSPLPGARRTSPTHGCSTSQRRVRR